VRSQRVAEFLAEAGYSQVENLSGGILAWSSEVDPKIPTY
jgi:rhodanese-related sulfurtransferase